MKLPRSTAIFLISFLVPALGSALARDFVFSTEEMIIPISTLERTGLEGAFLPHEKPAASGTPKRKPLDPKQPLRGTFTPQQFAVVQRSLSQEKLSNIQLPTQSAQEGIFVQLPATEGTVRTPLSVSASPLPENKIQVKIAGGDPSATQEAAVLPGEILVFSLPGKTPDSVLVYFVSVLFRQKQ